MPMRVDGSLAKNFSTAPRRICRRNTGCSFSPTPCIWKTCLDVSKPILIIVIRTAPLAALLQPHSLAQFDAVGGRPSQQGFQSPALGPRFRGDDELSCPQDFLTASKAGVHAHAALSRSVVSRTIVGGCPPDGTRVSAGNC